MYIKKSNSLITVKQIITFKCIEILKEELKYKIHILFFLQFFVIEIVKL